MADNDLVTIGETIALMPEASTANDPSELLDGQSGDKNFPFARFKPLATVGEVDPVTGDALTGYPDGNAAFLKDDDTITVVYQSESYGLNSKQTYGWEMASGVSFTGSHIHTIDYDREKFAEFLETGDSAADMFLESGHLFDTIYNVFGEVVDGKNDDATDLSAKWGNQTKPTGELVDFVINKEVVSLTEGDFFFQSFCGSFLETANKYGDGIGFEDNVWLTAEEWNIRNILPESNETMGLASIAVDVDTGIAYTVPALGQTGYEKLLPINPGHPDYVVIVLAGYNHDQEPAPLKIYVGVKGKDAAGNDVNTTGTDRDAFLARNGLLHGKIYGMAVADGDYADLGIDVVDPTAKMFDAYMKDADAATEFSAKFVATSYQWKGFDKPVAVKDTEMMLWEDAAEQPVGHTFFNGDTKVEHPAVDPDITKFRWVQNMTDEGGLIGIELTNLVAELTAANGALPDALSADVTRIIAAIDGEMTLETGDKGIGNGLDGLDDADNSKTDASETAEVHIETGQAKMVAPDGLMWVKTADGDFLIVDEDSGNDYGERKYIIEIDSDTMQPVETENGHEGYFLAQAGGKLNPRGDVASIPGAASSATSAEFSGSWNVSALVARKEDGSFYTKEELTGTKLQEVNESLALNESTFIGVLQHSSESGGQVEEVKADNGGQILAFNVDLGGYTELQLLHATDLESGFEQLSTAANMKVLADFYSNSDTLFISSGDNFIPGAYFNAGGDFSMAAIYNQAFNDFYGLDDSSQYADLRAEAGFADIAIMNLLEIDASVIGNHEFDAGASVFGDMITHYPRGAGLENDRWIGAQFPYLSANLDFSNSGLADYYTDEILAGSEFEITPEEAAAVTAKYQDGSGQKKLAPAAVLTTDSGETYGVIGVTTPYLASISSPGLVEVVNADGTRNDTIYNSDTRDAEMTELAKLVQVQVDRLEASGVNKIILTSHLQDFAYEKLLATKLDGVDIIIAGGSDTILANDADDLRAGDVAVDTYPVTNITDLSGNNTYLVSTDGQFNYLGRLNATFDSAGHVVFVDYENSAPISTETENVAAITGLKVDSDGNIDLADDGLNAGSSLIEKASIIEDVVNGLEAVAASKDSNVVGLTDVYLEGRRSKVRTEETNLGDLSADSLLHATRQFDTVFAFKNGGGIRSEIGDSSTDENNITTFTAPLANEQTGREEGEVSQLAIETSLKFNNGVTLLELSGSDLKEILEHGVNGFLNADSQPGQFPQVGGLYFSVDMDQQAGDRITEIALVDQDGFVTQHIYNNGSFVGDAATQEFRGASLNFLVQNDGDGYPFSTLAQNVEVIDGFGEQEAFAMLMSDQYLVEAYDTAETSKTYDTRIQFMDSEIFGEGREALVSLIPEASRSVAPKVASSTKLGSVADEGGAEIVSVDGAIAAVTNGIDNRVEILDMEDPEHPVHLGALDVREMASDDITLVGGITSFDLGEGITSVAIKGETVVASYKNGDVSLGGYVVTYKVPGGDLASATAMVSQVGVQPDCVILNADGTLAFTADEGEITIVNGEYVDPQGSISIIDTATGAVTKIGFDHLDAATLKAAGVRISDASSSAAADIEPEYVALSDDETLLFVTLQENNAVAKIDISGIVAGQTVNAADIMEILPLGYKDHNLAGNELDASDRDGEINITNHNVWGMYMPDTIKSYEVNGTNYFVIANEGDGRGDVDDMGEKGKFGDEARVKDLGDPGLPSLDANAGYTAEELADDQLGRLAISVIDGDTDGDGDIDQLVSFGARSFSIFDENGQLVFDSGSDFEAITASLSPLSFNDDKGTNGENRSDAKGPEPEALEIVRAGDSVYAIIGMERVNYVMVYDITDPSHATFINAVDIRALGDIAPEGMDVGVNENGDLMLYIASEVSSTVSAHYLTGNIEDDHGDSVIEGTDGADSIIQGAGSDVIVGNGGTDFYATSGHTSVISILDDADVALLERFHGDIFEDGASVARVETFTQFAVSESVDYVQVERLEHAGKILSFDDVELTPTLTDHGGDNHVRLGVGHYAVNMGDGHDEVAISHGNAVRLGDGDDTLFVSHGHDMVAELGDGHDMVVITNDAAIDLSIVDFAEGDQIDMSAIGVTAMSDMQMDLDNDGNILIQHGEVDITLVTGTANLTMGDIDASDFVFAAEII